MSSRYLALKVLINVIIHKRSLSDALAQIKNSTDDSSFIQALCYGVCRWYYRLKGIAGQLLAKPLKKKDEDVFILVLMGIYQLAYMNLPDYAAVSETVTVADKIKKIWAKGLINAVLRNFQRGVNINEEVLETHYAHPAWIISQLQQDWPGQWKSILAANNTHPPLSLRVNSKKVTREEYHQKLLQAGLPACDIPEVETGICLLNPVDVQDIPGFILGELSVQDGAAQLAASLLQVKAGQRILDACAAPGGKTSHILEIAPGPVELIALDQNADRLKSVAENLTRLELQAQCICADAGDPADWWDGKLFDRILLDAPCSAMGVIRRHPDIKLLRKASDIAALAQEQARLLSALWSLLQPGGLLVYATCSIFKAENIDVISSFLAQYSDAKEEKIIHSWGIECPWGRQILPGMHGMDGFYYVCLRKY